MAGVGTLRRWLTLATGLVECLCFALYGWPALVFVLKTEGYFGSPGCVDTPGANATQVQGHAQEWFSLVFAVASNLSNVLLLPTGFLLDRFGTAVARLMATFLFTTGNLMVAFSTPGDSHLLFPAFSFIGLGGLMFLMTNMQVGNLFSSHQTTVTTLYNGAFNSCPLFLVIKLLHEAGISLCTSFLFLATSSFTSSLLRTFFLMPRDHIPYPLPDDYTYGITCGKSKTLISEHTTASGEPQMKTEEMKLEDVPVTQEKSFSECLISKFYVSQLIWLSVIQLRQLFFVGTLQPMLQRLAGGQQSLVSHYTNVFAVTQLCGMLCAPWNGLIMDRLKGKPRAAGESEQEADLRALVLSLSLTVLQCALFSVCAAIPNLRLQYLTFVLYMINFAFLYGGNATFILVTFPLCHFGKLYGLCISLSSVICLLIDTCLSLLNGAILYVNICLTLLVLLAFINPLVVHLHCRGLASQRAASAAIGASSSLSLPH
ncbi:solute carrier family 43 member 3-like [Cyclopterus lumpus]|uniref:solute carrier family 43 member 3-like n=1 Tax=Cyclopterus lumpus TaxID=8103 RepID=UPI001486BA19|nr:solute carrier family 43 member 3-like [Cyclopterus lumpus]